MLYAKSVQSSVASQLHTGITFETIEQKKVIKKNPDTINLLIS